MAYEKDIKDLIEQMSRQQQGMNVPNGGGAPPAGGGAPYVDSSMGTDQSPHLMNESAQGPSNPDQSPINPINSVRPMGTPINNKPPKPAGMKMEGGCPQCGMVHPPLPAGQRCPMANVRVKNDKGEEKIIDVNKFLADLKNIILSQADQRKIKDIEKLFKNIIIEVTKFIEGYSE